MNGAHGMRTLVVAQDFPWPATIGSHLRLAQVLEAAGELGEVDLFALVPARRAEPCTVPADITLRRVGTAVRSVPRWSATDRLSWALSSRLPLEVVQERAPELPGRLRAFADGRYDAVWFSKPATFELLGKPRLGPTVVDLDDLEDRKILSRLAALKADRDSAALSVRGRAGALQARLNAARWNGFQRSVSRSVERVVLCSELDASRFGQANCTVVPNGYREPDVPLGRPEPGDPPTLLFAGSYCYGPNADAAHWLVSSIWPEVLARRPGATLRLVGEPDGSVLQLIDPPAVTVVGRVQSMDPELARADLVVVPLRYGSGTRVKILEAFAHRIPVVSTTLGAEGLGTEPGVHLLVADDPKRFAEACVELLEDTSLRRRLVDRAQELFAERFGWASARDRVKTLLEELARVVPADDEHTGKISP